LFKTYQIVASLWLFDRELNILAKSYFSRRLYFLKSKLDSCN